MATIDSKINVNSSWSKTIQSVSLTDVKLKMWIYTGTQGIDVSSGTELGASGDRLADPTYILNGTAVVYDSTKAVSFELSPLIKDYIESNLDNNLYNTDNVVWVDIQTTTTINGVETINASEHYLGVDGYEYTMPGNTLDSDNTIRISNRDIQYLKDSEIRVGVLRDSMVSYDFKKDGVSIVSGTSGDFLDSSESNDQLIYLENTLNSTDYLEVDTLEIVYDNGSESIRLIQVDECKYEPRKLTFVNKFGALQDVWMFKNSKRTITSKRDTWNRRNPVLGNSPNRANTLTGIQTISEEVNLNSGFYSEDENVIFEELVQSKNVWLWSLDATPQAQAVLVKNTSLEFKDSITDKLINYTIKLEYAFNKIKAL